MSTKTRFENEAKGNLEMAYYITGQKLWFLTWCIMLSALWGPNMLGNLTNAMVSWKYYVVKLHVGAEICDFITDKSCLLFLSFWKVPLEEKWSEWKYIEQRLVMKF